MAFIHKIFHHAAAFSLVIWVVVSVLRVINHTQILLSEPALIPPPINNDYGFNYAKDRFYLYPTPMTK